MPALEIISFIGTAIGATLAELTTVAGDSSTIRNTALDQDILLTAAWAFNQVDGEHAIRSPELHDNTQGIRFNTTADEIKNSIPYSPLQKLFPQADLTILGAGSAVAADIEALSLLVYYNTLPGIEARLISVEDLNNRALELASLTNSIAAGTSGAYTAGERINDETDILKANQDYAILGATISAAQCTIGYSGADFGNLRIGLPGDPDNPDLTKDFFVRLAKETGLAVIPVFNSANADNLLVSILGNENAATPRINTMLARLSPAA